jgi:hypothetical protein
MVEFTPIFFIGSTAGVAFTNLFGKDIATFAAIGFVSLLAGATNTSIASSIMAIELFGPNIAPYAAMSCIISFLMTGHRCVYPSQVLGIRKSRSIFVDMGTDMSKVETSVRSRKKSILGIILRWLESFKDEDESG